MKKKAWVEFNTFAVFYEGLDALSTRRLDRMLEALIAERRRREHLSTMSMPGGSSEVSASRQSTMTAGASSDASGDDPRFQGSAGSPKYPRLVIQFEKNALRCDGLGNLTERELDIAILLVVRKLKQRQGYSHRALRRMVGIPCSA